MPDRLHPLHTLKDLGYFFNNKGELRTIEGDEPFKFTTQEEYELLGDAMTHEVYQLMENIGLQRLTLKKPTDTKPDEHYSFVYASHGFEEKSTLLILIHGMGAVRAGQWSRRLILNESLEKGSQIPYIERALLHDWGVLVTNANLNEHVLSNSGITHGLQYSKNPTMHMESLWYRFVRFARASNIYVVAHSRGGHDISNIMETFPDENRVNCICLTDSWFEFPQNRDQQPLVINWAARDKNGMRKPGPRAYRDDEKVHQIWAGTTEHERSSSKAIESIFHVIENSHHENNIDKLLLDAWDIMDPPQLSAEGFDDESMKIISKDKDGNVKINESHFTVAGADHPDDNGDSTEEMVEKPRNELSEEQQEDEEPNPKHRRLE